MLIVRRALRAHERFLADARAGLFPTEQDVEAAYAERVAPVMRELREAQARSLAVRADVEDAVSKLGENGLAVGDYLEANEDARDVAALLAENDPVGDFAYVTHQGES